MKEHNQVSGILAALPRSVCRTVPIGAILVGSISSAFAQNYVRPTTNRELTAYTSVPAPDLGGSKRPSFLAPPQPLQPNPDEFSPLAASVAPAPAPTAPVAAPAPAPEPMTMMTQLELPVPQPVAQAPGAEATLLAQAQGPATIQADSAPTSVALNVPAETPGGGSPAIVYEREQKGLPAPVAPALPPPPPADPGKWLREKKYSELEPFALKAQDTRLASAVGWALYNDGSTQRGQKWFQQALEWDERNYEAAYGLALALTKQKRYEQAEEVARWRLAQYPQMANVLGDIVTARAVAAYQAKDYRRSRETFEEVKTYRKLSRDEQIVQAWNLFHSGDLSAAGSEFERLYAEKRDKFAANGLYATYAKQKKWDELKALAANYGGPLEKLYTEYVAQRYYDRGLYASAYHAAPKKFPQLQGYTSPSVAAAGKVRFKTGDSGTSELREIRGEATGVLYQNDYHRLSAKIGLTSLDAGSLPKDALIGKAPLTNNRTLPSGVKTQYDSLVDLRLRYEREGIYTPHVELGISPAGGEVSPTIVGSAGLRSTQEWGTWSAEVYRESVKESILSYTGMKDPYSGDTWGRVSDSGVRLTIFAPLEDQWNVYGEFLAGVLDGENVESNNHVRLSLSFHKQIEHPDFAYITLGPSFAFEHYAKNLSYFTFGQGGYFSPDYLFQGTLGVQFMTKEGRSYILKGGADLGLQSYRQGTTSIFPLEDSQSIYPGQDEQTFIATVNLAGLVQLSPHWALGGNIGYNRTADYSEFVAGVTFKYFFEPRTGLFATDLASH